MQAQKMKKRNVAKKHLLINASRMRVECVVYVCNLARGSRNASAHEWPRLALPWPTRLTTGLKFLVEHHEVTGLEPSP